MNWRCAIGLHDWWYSKEDLPLETIDSQGKAHRVVLKSEARGNTRICRRCDKRQEFWSDMEDWGWATKPSHEAVLERYPKERVEIREP